MSHDPLAPSIQPPPRQVQPWTSVLGHNVSRSRAFCECGARPPREFDGADSDWREQHLREAWPVLVPRLADEALGDWMGRVSDELVAVAQLDQQLYGREGHHRGLAPGEPIPTITTEMIDAGNRVDVLQHQLDEVTELFLRAQGHSQP